MTPNLALLSLPVFYGVILYPSRVALTMILRADRRTFNNASPRSRHTLDAYEKLLGPQGFAKWERCKAANTQGYEMFGLVAAAVLSGLHAGLPERRMAIVAWTLVLLRIIFNELYMRIETRKMSYWRSANYFTSLFICLWTFIAAAWRSEQ